MTKAIILMIGAINYGQFNLHDGETERDACYRAMASLGIEEISAGAEMMMNAPLGTVFSGGVTYEDGSKYPFGTEITIFAGRTIPGHIVTCLPAPEKPNAP